jgi:hypothetical protein
MILLINYMISLHIPPIYIYTFELFSLFKISVHPYARFQFLYWYDKPLPSVERKAELLGKLNYIIDDPELEFFDDVPTTWDETKVLYARIGEYGVIARRKGVAFHLTPMK